MHTRILFFLIPTCILITAGDHYLSEGTKLYGIRITRQHLSGLYHNFKGKGVHFKSESSKTSKFITVTTLSGKNVFSSSMIDKSKTIMSVMNRDYLITPRGNYLVPSKRKNWIMKALKHKIPPTYFYRYLDGHDVKKASFSDFSELVHSEEAKLIQEAALELGRRGIKGLDSTAVMVLYVLAMRLANFQPAPIDDTLHDCRGMLSKLNRKKYFQSRKLVHLCENNGEHCETCPSGEECGGMCGPKCHCWKMVCGDCCYHHGCFDHDKLCRDIQPSLNCFRVFGFKCDGLLSET